MKIKFDKQSRLWQVISNSVVVAEFSTVSEAYDYVEEFEYENQIW
jgi:hypothetical protein